MPGQSAASISQCVRSARCGDQQAAAELWQAYFIRLVGLARRRLGDNPYRVEPEEAVSSAFRVFFDGLSRDRFGWLSHQDETWLLLAKLVVRKAREKERALARLKRGGERPDHGGAWKPSATPVDELADPRSAPGFAHGALVLADLVGLLPDDQLRLVALWRLEGRDQREIARMLGCAVITVRRKLNLIRDYWRCELE